MWAWVRTTASMSCGGCGSFFQLSWRYLAGPWKRPQSTIKRKSFHSSRYFDPVTQRPAPKTVIFIEPPLAIVARHRHQRHSTHVSVYVGPRNQYPVISIQSRPLDFSDFHTGHWSLVTGYFSGSTHRCDMPTDSKPSSLWAPCTSKRAALLAKTPSPEPQDLFLDVQRISF